MSPSVRAQMQSYSFLSFFCLLPSWSTDLLQILGRNNHCRAGNVWCFWSERICMCVCVALKKFSIYSQLSWPVSDGWSRPLRIRWWRHIIGQIYQLNVKMHLCFCPVAVIPDQKLRSLRRNSSCHVHTVEWDITEEKGADLQVPVSRDLGLWGKAV